MDAPELSSKGSTKILAVEQICISIHQLHQPSEQGISNLSQDMNDLQLARNDSLASRKQSTSTFFGKSWTFWALMLASSFALILGASSANLLGRLYFVHGGSRRWLYTWIESAGWPVIAIPLLICYRCQSIRPTPLTPKLLIIYLVMGCLTALDNLLYSWGISYLPVSTNSLVCSSQLAFNAVFAYALVGQNITPYVMNAVVVITTGTVLLGVRAESDRPQGTTEKQYIIGFVVTVAASALYALLLPLVELVYGKVIGKTSFAVVMEVQIGISIVAALFSLVGMWISGDFRAMTKEATQFDLGSTAYSMTLIWSAVGWQLYFLGYAGVIFLTSSLMSCVFTTAIFPLLPILGVIFFHDSFSALKSIAMLLTLWGFVSYLYGGYVNSKDRHQIQSAA